MGLNEQVQIFFEIEWLPGKFDIIRPPAVTTPIIECLRCYAEILGGFCVAKTAFFFHWFSPFIKLFFQKLLDW
jgi:hypothetical protein